MPQPGDHQSELLGHPGRIVVFGASGYVGGTVARYLTDTAATPVVGYSSSDFDLTDPDMAAAAVRTLRSDDAVVYASAITRRVEESWDALLKNVEMVRNLLAAIPTAGIRSLLAFSTVDVYGMPPVVLPITTDSPMAPDGYYSLSMTICESLFRIDGPGDVPLTILRLPSVYGPGDRGMVVSLLADRVRNNDPVRLYGGGADRRDFLWSGDIGPVVARFIDAPAETALNLVSGTSISIRELVDKIGRALFVTPLIEEAPAGSRSGDFEFDTSHLRQLIPEFSPTPIDSGIEMLVNA